MALPEVSESVILLDCLRGNPSIQVQYWMVSLKFQVLYFPLDPASKPYMESDIM